MKKATITKIFESIVENKEVELNDKEVKYKERILFILQLKLDNITITDKDIYYLVNEKHSSISFPQIMKDIGVTERIFSSIKDKKGDAQKVFSRYLIVESLKHAFNVAKEKNDVWGMTTAANLIGKHNLTDKEDVEKVDWDKIIPFQIEITNNPEILGIKPADNLDELKEKLSKKYAISEQSKKLQELDSEIQDVEYEE